MACERLLASKTYRIALTRVENAIAAGGTRIAIARIPELPRRVLSAWLTRNAEGGSYRRNCEVRRQSRRKVWEAHHHRGSAEGYAGRKELPGCPVPVRL